ncbi:hypothetical protein EYF80_014614 [Liparis tanakae]|uniref:Uncharacterized protein n=1 Tax=Liparis tanakae TaxID=230148 RepID=A0A4Z2ICV9_9TELE|nr:hypothetical protein EYF80_014614 [Liparis tanakae]
MGAGCAGAWLLSAMDGADVPSRTTGVPCPIVWVSSAVVAKKPSCSNTPVLVYTSQLTILALDTKVVLVRPGFRSQRRKAGARCSESQSDMDLKKKKAAPVFERAENKRLYFGKPSVITQVCQQKLLPIQPLTPGKGHQFHHMQNGGASQKFSSEFLSQDVSEKKKKRQDLLVGTVSGCQNQQRSSPRGDLQQIGPELGLCLTVKREAAGLHRLGPRGCGLTKGDRKENANHLNTGEKKSWETGEAAVVGSQDKGLDSGRRRQTTIVLPGPHLSPTPLYWAAKDATLGKENPQLELSLKGDANIEAFHKSIVLFVSVCLLAMLRVHKLAVAPGKNTQEGRTGHGLDRCLLDGHLCQDHHGKPFPTGNTANKGLHCKAHFVIPFLQVKQEQTSPEKSG